MAQELELDLVEISPNSDPPVCKVIDYSKFKYSQKKKQKSIKSDSQKNVLKEIDIESSKNTLLYFQYKNEIPTNLIIDELLKYSNNIYMPRIVSENELKFNLFKVIQELKG